jgi:hypothetical protein
MVDVKEFIKPEKPNRQTGKQVDDRVTNLVGGVVLLGILLSIIGLWTGVRAVANWGGTHEILGQRMISLSIQLPFRIETRKPLSVLSPLGEAVLKTIDDPLSDKQTAVMTKFGSVEFKVVDAIIKCESNYNAEAIHYNSNGTYDAGLMQINQLHWNKEYCPFGLKDLLDVNNNIECGYQIYLRNNKSFQAWSSLGNGCVADKL